MKTEENPIIKQASKSLANLNTLKILLVKMGDYESAAACRELEKELYPVSQEESEAKRIADELRKIFNFCNIPDNLWFLIYSLMKEYIESPETLTIQKITEIKEKVDSLFQR